MGTKYELSKQELKKLNMNLDYIKKVYIDIKDNSEKDLSSELIQKFGSHCTTFLSEFGFWDKMISFMNIGDQDKDRYNNATDGVFGIMQQYMKNSRNQKSKELSNYALLGIDELIKLENSQFNFSNKYPNDPEVIANLMFVANSCAHMISDNSEIYTRLYSVGIKKNDIVNLFYEIKSKCLEKLVELKKEGKQLLIEKANDSYDNDVIFIAIPGYFEPFSVHSKGAQLNLDKYDNIAYRKNGYGELMKTTFPLKISEPKKQVMEYLQREIVNSNELRSIKDRVIWYTEAQSKFRKFNRTGKIITLPENITSNEQKPQKNIHNKKENKKEQITEQNLMFLQQINDELGDIITPNMMDGFLSRASYSFEKLFNKRIQNIDYLKQIPEEKRKKVALELFVYIRLFEKMSILNVDTVRGIPMINNAIKNYEKLFYFLIEHKNEDLSFKEIKKLAKHFIDIGEAQESSIDEEQLEESNKQNNLEMEEEFLSNNATPEVFEQDDKHEINDTTISLEDMSIEELQIIKEKNNKIIRNNDEEIKKALIDEILKQQQTIAQQESRISKLRTAKSK